MPIERGMEQLLIVSLLLLVLTVRGTEILEAPVSQNAFLDSTVRFSCTGRAVQSAQFVFVSWRVNDELVNTSLGYTVENQMDMLDQRIISSNLSFSATASLNGSSIKCTVFAVPNDQGMHEEVDAPRAYLTLQGLLNGVSSLSVQYEPNIAIISWTPPYSLPGLSIEYHIFISNGSFDHLIAPVTLTDRDSFNISTEEAMFSSCTTYNFTVRPWNPVGNASSNSVAKFYRGAPVAPLLQSVVVTDVITDQTDGTVDAIISFPVTSSCFSQQNITLVATSLSQTYTTLIADVDNESKVTVNVFSLPPDMAVSLKLTLSNTLGEASLANVVIRTYDVQRIEVINSTSDGVSCFNCTLITNSTALGCNITLTPLMSSPTCMQETSLLLLTTDEPSPLRGCIDRLYRGVYTVSGYDVESDGEIGQERAVVLERVNLQGMLCPSTTVDLSMSSTSPPTAGTSNIESSNTVLINPTVTSVDDSVTGLRTAGILISVFGSIIILTISIMISVFIYNKCQTKEGVLTITSDRSESTPVRVDRVDGSSHNTESPELVAVHPYTSQVKSEYSPPPHTDTMETSLQIDEAREEAREEKGVTNKFVVMQSTEQTVAPVKGRDSRSSSRCSSTSSHSLLPPLRYTRYGSGEYDHLTGDEVMTRDTAASVPLDEIVINSKFPHTQESEVL